MAYQEEDYSVNLMKINSYYINQSHSNKKYMMLKSLLEQIRHTKRVIKIIADLKYSGLGVKKVMLKSLLNRSVLEDYELDFSFDHSYELNYKSNTFISKKIAVYTSIFGNYDLLIEPLYISPYCDYYAITDQSIPEGSAWKAVDTKNISSFDALDNYHKSKFCKMFPNVLFPNYEYSIWVDGNVQIVADMYPIIDRIPKECVIGMFQNPKHNCIYTEANYNIYMGNVKAKAINNQIEYYRKEGFPEHFGLREFSIIARRHNNPICLKLMDDWWNQVNMFTMRDQISFPYVLWKNGYTIDFVYLLGTNWRWNPRFICYPHNWHIHYK